MTSQPRRWYVVVGEALLEAAEHYQQCRASGQPACSTEPKARPAPGR